jgi:hypothetical protein
MWVKICTLWCLSDSSEMDQLVQDGTWCDLRFHHELRPQRLEHVVYCYYIVSCRHSDMAMVVSIESGWRFAHCYVFQRVRKCINSSRMVLDETFNIIMSCILNASNLLYCYCIVSSRHVDMCAAISIESVWRHTHCGVFHWVWKWIHSSRMVLDVTFDFIMSHDNVYSTPRSCSLSVLHSIK